MLFLGIARAGAQSALNVIKGKVLETDETNKLIPLIGANIYWSGTTIGTVSAPDGSFSISKSNETSLLVISFTGYQPDTIEITDNNYLEIILDNKVQIEGIEVVVRQKTTSYSLFDPIKIERIGEGELEKAACCNLSESFETNASIDVSFTDAITGTKQIQMLGLAGPYTQITRENIPDIRGLSAIYGMEYIPGTWIESIQLNKGAGSVVNGFESIAGQINVELRKPESADRFYLNVYGNEDSRIEANLNLAKKLNDNLSTAILIHARTQHFEMDKNQDGFMDKPLGSQYVFLNRWKYTTKSNWQSQLGVKGTYNENQGGQIGSSVGSKENLWRMTMETKRIEGWMKLGKIFNNNPTKSIGMQISGLIHDQNSEFGLKNYSGQQKSGYGNFIFQSKQNVYHGIKLGASLQYDSYIEQIDSLNFDRKEIVPGIFTEYSFTPSDKFSAVAGIRADYHNIYGFFITPRLHVRYAPVETTVLRFSLGRGQRTASIFAENNSVLASSREFQVFNTNNKRPYGLDPEIAWNFGTNFTQKFTLDYRQGAVTVDLYHTKFNNQVIVDLDNSPQTVLFYNLTGKSFSTSFQTQVDYELIRRLDVRMAYRYYNVQSTYNSGLKKKPLLSPHRAFINLAYGTRNYWKFDYTVQWQSSKRIPSTLSNPIQYQLAENSPSFFLMNTQVSKQWHEKFDVYLGVENILDFKQENPILASDDPFGQYFDSSLIWGPIFGRMVYAGIRLKIK